LGQNATWRPHYVTSGRTPGTDMAGLARHVAKEKAIWRAAEAGGRD
jgi:hypothetical protein